MRSISFPFVLSNVEAHVSGGGACGSSLDHARDEPKFLGMAGRVE